MSESSMIVGGATWTVFPRFVVPCQQDKREMFETLVVGCYDRFRDPMANQNHFPIRECDDLGVELEPVLVHFGVRTGDGAVLNHAREHALIYPKPGHTLTFGMMYPEPQKQFQIVATADSGSASVWLDRAGSRYVLLLFGGQGRRDLHVVCCPGSWGGNYRFLFFRR